MAALDCYQLCGGEARLEVGDEVIGMLRADGQAEWCSGGCLIEQLLRRELGMRRRGGMDDQTLDVRDVGQQGEDLQMVDEAVRLGLAACDLKGEDGAAAVREVFLVESLLFRIIRYRRMVYLLYERMVV